MPGACTKQVIQVSNKYLIGKTDKPNDRQKNAPEGEEPTEANASTTRLASDITEMSGEVTQQRSNQLS